jgi:hypothetical protein
MLVNLTILAKKISLIRIFRTKNQREKKMYLRGTLDSSQFLITWEK